jgi:hypothetical protein
MSVPPAYDEGQTGPNSGVASISTKDRATPVPRDNTRTPQLLRRNVVQNPAIPSPNDGPAAPMPRLPGTAYNAFREGTWSPPRHHGSLMSRAPSTARWFSLFSTTQQFLMTAFFQRANAHTVVSHLHPLRLPSRLGLPHCLQ